MPRLDYKNCRCCGRNSSEVGELSHTRLCVECGRLNLETNVRSLVAHRGVPFQGWRRAIAASVGAVVLDDVLPPA